MSDHALKQNMDRIKGQQTFQTSASQQFAMLNECEIVAEISPSLSIRPTWKQNPFSSIPHKSIQLITSQQTSQPSTVHNIHKIVVLNEHQRNSGHSRTLKEKKQNSTVNISHQSTELANQQTPHQSTNSTMVIFNEGQRNTGPSTPEQNPTETIFRQNTKPITSQQTFLPSNGPIFHQVMTLVARQKNHGPSNIWQQDPVPSTWQQDPGPSTWQQDPGPSTWQQDPGSFMWQFLNNKTHIIENNVIDVSVETQQKRKADEELPSARKKSRKGKLPNLNSNYKSDYEKLLELENNLVTNSKDFECLKCFNYVPPGDGVVLHECLHSFCRPCLISEVENSLLPVIKCPSRNQSYICDANLQEIEIKLLVPADLYERHLQLSATIAEVSAANSYHCNTAGCQGWCFYEEGVKTFVCQICGHVNCLTCFGIHEGKSCEQYLKNLVFDINNELIKQNIPQINTSRIGDMIAVFCQLPDCQGFSNIDKNETIFICPSCNLANCLSCEAIHEGQSCKDYQESANLQAVHLRSDKNNNEKDYEKLMKLTTLLVPNPEPFSCPICFDDIPKGKGVILHECLHNFCRECLISTVKHSETPNVKCPFMDENYACESFLRELEIKSLVSPELYEKHLHLSVTIAEGCAENSFHCKTPDCPGWCLYEDNVEYFKCPVCKHKNCVICAAIHENLTCKAYQRSKDKKKSSLSDDDQQRKSEKHIEKLIKSGLAMRCPKCKIILKKEEGCDGITCTLCKTEVCWATKGPRWGPDGKGDLSGGCRCMVNGKRCHKSCSNCH